MNVLNYNELAKKANYNQIQSQKMPHKQPDLIASSAALSQLTQSIKTNFIDIGKSTQHGSKSQFTLDNIFKNINFEQQAKDEFGNLHPHYTEPIRKGYESAKDYVELYTNDILNAVREIDLLCIKTSHRNIDNYQKCKAKTNNQIHTKIYIPIVNASALLYRVSNLCLLKGNSIDVCSNIIMEHTHFLFKLAAERSALLKVPLEQQVPKELQAPFLKGKKNNAIKD